MNASQRSVKTWDVASGAALGTSATTFWNTSADMSPDGSLLALGSNTGAVELWNVATRETLPLPRFHSERVVVRFSPDGTTLATGSTDHSLILWNVRSREVTCELHFPWPVRVLEFSPDGKTLATGEVRTVTLLRVSDGLEVTRWEGSTDVIMPSRSLPTVASSPAEGRT